MGKVLIDGDIIAYRAAFSCDKDFEYHATAKVDELIDNILTKTISFATADDYEVYLSGSTNFRYEIAKHAEYKGNRSDKPKPRYLSACRQHMVDEYGAVITDWEEADDAIATRATELGEDTIIASVDKDFLQVPCVHYNFLKETFTEVSPEEARYNFYTQVLVGDAADNIKGAYKIGPVKAEKILKGCETDLEFWLACVKAHGSRKRALEDARLLWLRREKGELWEPPEE